MKDIMDERDTRVVNSTVDYLVEKGRDRNFLEDYAIKLVTGANVDKNIGDYVSLRLLEVFDS